MFNSERAKEIGHAIRQQALFLLPALSGAFEKSIVGEKDEVRFFDKLLVEIPAALPPYINNINFRVRIARTHKKPIVKVGGPNGFGCELGDLLVVVKYNLGGGRTERKSLLYQVKLCEAGKTDCKIDQDQLTLLTAWPPFAFGLMANGGPVTYHVQPKTLEFGSYMLMLRAPGAPLFPYGWPWPQWGPPCYGVSPYAQEVKSNGANTVDIARLPHASGAAGIFFSHLGFKLGEHHDFNKDVEDLVAALYRHLKLDPDPPDEFDGFTRDVNPEEDPGFAIIEVTAGPEKQ